jgi:outer membrane protein assembly factor BamB
MFFESGVSKYYVRDGSLGRATIMLCALLALPACGDWLGDPAKTPLPGERIAVLSLSQKLKVDTKVADLQVRLPRPFVNDDWPQSGGDTNHAMHHLAADGKLARLWNVNIGTGSDSERQILAQPVIVGNRIYTMDVEAEVRSMDVSSGELLWRTKLAPDDDDDGILGGGLALSGGKLYVTTGFAQLIALNAATGKILWRRSLSGPMRSGPTVSDGRVFAVTVANELFALSVDDGHTLWTHIGITEVAGLLGGGSPAVEGDIVVAPFSSGEIVALRVQNGRVVWSDSLSALRRTDPVSSIAHIKGRPVIDRGRVYVVGHSNRTVAIDIASGSRVWEQPIGGVSSPWIAGDYIYLISNEGELICLLRKDGRVRWIRPLPQFEDEEDKEDPIRWSGPVLAGDRLLAVGSNGRVWSVSPYTGALLGSIDVSGPVAISPAIANQTLFLLTDDAELIAFR